MLSVEKSESPERDTQSSQKQTTKQTRNKSFSQHEKRVNRRPAAMEIGVLRSAKIFVSGWFVRSRPGEVAR